MWTKLFTANEAFRVDSGVAYEKEAIIGPTELELLIQSLKRTPDNMNFSANTCESKLNSSVSEYMKNHFPLISLDESVLHIYYKFDVEIMGLLEVNNARCDEGKCGRAINVEDTVIFNVGIIQYHGMTVPSVSLSQVHESGKTCRIKFVRSGDYGGFEVCKQLLNGGKGSVIEVYKNSIEKNMRKL